MKATSDKKHPAKTYRADDFAKEKSAALAGLAGDLPEDEAALLDAALGAIGACHDAVLRGDGAAAEAACGRYEAVVWKLNGGKHHGSMADDADAGKRIELYCCARSGDVPLWGQTGEFLVRAGPVRAWVQVGDGFGSPLVHCQFEFHAVDLDKAFISETGYHRHFSGAQGGYTVDQVATTLFAEQLQTHRRYLEPEAQNRLADVPLSSWVEALTPPPRRTRSIVEETIRGNEPIPSGFELVDVVLASRQAFIVRKWAKAAREKSKAAGMPAARLTNRRGPLNGNGAQPEVVRIVEENGRFFLSLNGDAPTGPFKTKELAETYARVWLHGPNSLEDSGSPTKAFQPGTRCKIVSIYHPCFEANLGKVVIVTKVNSRSRTVYAQADSPITYRINRTGRRVVASDPSCIQTIYAMSELQII